MQVRYKISSLQHVQVIHMCSMSSRNKTWRGYFSTWGCVQPSKIAPLGWTFPLLKLPREERSHGREKIIRCFDNSSSILYIFLEICVHNLIHYLDLLISDRLSSSGSDEWTLMYICILRVIIIVHMMGSSTFQATTTPFYYHRGFMDLIWNSTWKYIWKPIATC